MNDQALVQLLTRYPARFQPLSPLEALGGGGGLSGARLWRFRAEHGVLLLRAWPSHGPGRNHIEEVQRWLSLTADLGFVPVPIRDSAGRSLIEWDGVLWELAPWMSGGADRSHPPPVARLRLAFTGLAAFHQRLICEQVEGVSAGLRQRHHEISQLLRGGFRALEAAIDRRGDAGLPHRLAAHRWLSLAHDAAPFVLDPLDRALNQVIRLQPTIRDARPEHFLFTGDCLSGLVDFGAMGVDSVAGDLSRLIGEWLDGDPAARSEALASYERVRPLDPAEARLIGVFEAATAVLIGERWVRWLFVEDRRFDDPQAVANGLERGLKQLDRLVRQPGGPGLAW